MHSRTAALFVTALRILAGFALMLAAIPLLIQGGLSRYAKYRMPAHPDWRYLAIGLAMAAAGAFVIRPFWWRQPGNRHRG